MRVSFNDQNVENFMGETRHSRLNDPTFPMPMRPRFWTPSITNFWLRHWMCQIPGYTREGYLQDGSAVFMVKHLGTLPTISPRPLTSLLGFVCVLQTATSSLYLAVVSTHSMAVGRFRSA